MAENTQVAGEAMAVTVQRTKQETSSEPSILDLPLLFQSLLLTSWVDGPHQLSMTHLSPLPGDPGLQPAPLSSLTVLRLWQGSAKRREAGVPSLSPS